MTDQPIARESELKPEGVCMDCGGVNPVWFAPNEVWNIVIGGPDAKGDPGGFYCPNCFIVRATAAGVLPTAWELRPERLEDESRSPVGDVEGVIERCVKVADEGAQLARAAVSQCDNSSPVQAEWSRARDLGLDIAEGIRALKADPVLASLPRS